MTDELHSRAYAHKLSAGKALDRASARDNDSKLRDMEMKTELRKLKDLLSQKEGQCFERKSIRVEPKSLAVSLVAFANADGGTMLIGVNDKGARFYEDTPVSGATAADLDLNLVRAYTKRIGYSKPPLHYLRENGGFIRSEKNIEHVSAAAILLFGKAPQQYFPRARIRFIRYEGTEEKTGANMNVIKDVSFEGTVLEMVRQAVAFLSTQTKEHTYLGKDGLFVTNPQYPDFVRQEIIVNAVAHRDYSIKGTDIQIKMFDDRLVVESPGTLPGLVRLNTMRNVHFSRNPKIAAFLRAFGYVKEFGEGVDRMCRELIEIGVRPPKYDVVAFMLHCTVRGADVGHDTATDTGARQPADKTPAPSSGEVTGEVTDEVTGEVTGEVNRLLQCLKNSGREMTRGDLQKALGLKGQANFRSHYLIPALKSGMLEMTIPEKPRSRFQKYRLSRQGKVYLKMS